MLGILYLLLCISCGYMICRFAFPQLNGIMKRTFRGASLDVTDMFVKLPAWFFTGTLAVTWIVYLAACLCSGTEEPLKAANIIAAVISAAGICIGVFFIIRGRKKARAAKKTKNEPVAENVFYTQDEIIAGPVNTTEDGMQIEDEIRSEAGDQSEDEIRSEAADQSEDETAAGSGPIICEEIPKTSTAKVSRHIQPFEVLISSAFLSLAILLMYTSFVIIGNRMYVGLSVFSDFTPHVSMIRSFSRMNNFPTWYTVCAGEDVKYHFMFTFLVGNLEYLGLRLDHAFNIPSILGFVSAFSMLYALTLKITGKRLAGLFAAVMFAFRSSYALLGYLANVRKGTVLETLLEGRDFIGTTNHEDWGLWNLNVYCNQRHFALSLAILLFVLILYLEPLYEAFARFVKTGLRGVSALASSFFSREGWLPRKILLPISTGILLGAMGFWNGAVLIAAVVILFFIAVMADRRLEYLILAVCTGILALIQSRVFIADSAFDFRFRFGFLADNTTAFGVLDYLIRLTGLLLILTIAAFVISRAVERYMIVVFSMPLVLSFFISLTPDIAVNHKYIMVSLMLVGIFGADAVRRIFELKGFCYRAAAVLLLLCLTSTGIYEFAVIMRKNNLEYSIRVDVDNPVRIWINENCDSRDLFLTANYYLNGDPSGAGVISSGASMYNAWQYFGWSAGYNTSARDDIVARAFGAQSPEELAAIVENNGFDYAVIDRTARYSEFFELNESVFDDTYEVVFSCYEGDSLVKIYDLGKRVGG